MASMHPEAGSGYPPPGPPPAAPQQPYYAQPTAQMPHHRPVITEEARRDLTSVEFVVFAVAVVAILIASAVVGTDVNGHGDYFRADLAWILITVLAVGFMIARAITKSGRNHDRYLH